MVGVGQPPAHHQRAGVLRDARIEGLDRALEGAAGIGANRKLDRGANLHFADIALGHREVDPDRVERLQPNERIAGLHILPLLHAAKTEPAGEGRRDILLRDEGFHALHRGSGGISLRGGGIDHGLGHDRLLDEARLPLEVGVGLEQDCAVPGEIGFLDRGVERDELGALGDVVAALEEIIHDNAADLGRHVDALDGDQRADRPHPVDPGRGRRLRGGDGRRRWRHLGHELGDHLRLEHEIEIADAAEEQGDKDGGNDKALDHGA